MDIDYEVEKGNHYTWIRLNKGLSIELQTSEPVRARGEIFPTSVGNGYEGILKIVDNTSNQPLLQYLKDHNYQELNHWHCAQWGTWKFSLNNMKIIEDIYDNFY